MLVKVKIPINKKLFFDYLIDKQFETIKKSNKRNVKREDILKGIKYSVFVNNKNQKNYNIDITITNVKENEFIEAFVSSKDAKIHYYYLLNEMDENNCEVTYYEDVKNIEKGKNITFKGLASYMHERKAQKNAIKTIHNIAKKIIIEDLTNK